MRMLMRVSILLLVLFVALGVAAALMLPRLVQSDAVRGRVAEAAREATGREVSYAALDVGLLPPSLVVKQARVAGPSPEAEAMLEGADVELRLALLPLLMRAVVVDSLVVEGATLRLVRGAEGLELPTPEAPPAGGEAKAEAGRPAEAQAEPGMALALRQLKLRDTRVVLEDRAVEPAVTWDLREIRATVEGDSLDDPIEIDLAARLGSGGALRASGRVQQEGPFALDVELEEVALAPLAPYLPEGSRATGSLSGRVDARGRDLAPEELELDLSFSGGELALDEVEARGAVSVRADVKGGMERPEGSFSLDASEAALRYGGSFEKPPGTPATAEGRIVTGADGSIGIDDTRVRIRNLEARGALETGERSRLRVDASPFALEGWEELLPALRESPLAGRLGLDGLELATEPLSVRGRVTLDGVQLQSAEGEHLLLRGALLGEGDAIRDDALVAEVAGHSAPLELRIGPLTGAPRAALRTSLKKADSNQLLSAFAGKADTLSGPLDLDVDVAMPLGGEIDPTGSVRFAIRPGRLQGVSLLRSALARFGAVGQAAVIAGRVRGGSTLQRFYDDEFESLEGSLRLGGGRARTDDLRLVYRHYSVDLRGSVRFEDLALDLTGELTIGEEVDAALAGAPEAEGSQPAAAEDPPSAGGRRRVLPLAQVGGTLDAPKVVLSQAAIERFALHYVLANKSDKLEEYRSKIDERLGEGTGDQVIEALEGLLGGRRRP